MVEEDDNENLEKMSLKHRELDKLIPENDAKNVVAFPD